MVTVYVDVLIGLNLFVNYFIFLAVSKIARVPIKNARHLLVSFLLSLTALIMLLPRLSWPLALLVRLATAAAGVVLGFGLHGFKAFCKLFGAFFSASFAFAGIMLALWTCFKPAGLLVHNGIVYFDISPVILVLSTVAAYGLIWLLRKHFGKESAYPGTYVLHLQQNSRTVTVHAKVDTGLSLRDPYDDLPLILIDPNVLKSLVGSPAPSVYRLLPYRTVGGSGMLASVVCHHVTVERPGGAVTLSPVVLAVSEQPFEDDFKALIGCDFTERMEQGHETAQTVARVAAHQGKKPTDRLHQRLRHPAAALEKGRGTGADGSLETRR